jgi:hypothetical protein
MEQASSRTAQTFAALGIHTPGIPIPGELQNAPGHQKMSLSSI